MVVILATSARNDACDAIVDLVDIDGAGTLEFYTATYATLLAELVFNATAFGSASTGTASANAINADTSANATGVAERFRFITGDGVPLLSGTVSAGSGGDINLNTTSINVGDSVSISSLTVTVPAGTF
jgi:hypothetical protein